jgi:hypothetical protein
MADKALIHCIAVIAAVIAAVIVATRPVSANRLTFEAWPDANPANATFCSIALTEGWLTLVQVRGAGLPAKRPQRWRASDREEDAVTAVLQAFLAGNLTSVDPYGSRLPPAPFVTVTWMTTLDDQMATGLYIQPGLALPAILADVAITLGLERACGLTAKAAG